MAHVCVPPAEICFALNPTPKKTGCKLVMSEADVPKGVVVTPSPSWPYVLSPQHFVRFVAVVMRLVTLVAKVMTMAHV
jgi:hypothetical protein